MLRVCNINVWSNSESDQSTYVSLYHNMSTRLQFENLHAENDEIRSSTQAQRLYYSDTMKI